jgi:oxygen-dependent protoporphyrinogen oxidase
MTTSMGPRVAVIGAGPAGLAAAHRLQQGGAAVMVLEERQTVGGRLRTDVVDGYHIDTAAQLFGSMYRDFFRVLGEVGAADLAVRTTGRDALWRRGRAQEVIYGNVPSMLASGALPFGTKLRLGASYLPFLTRHADVLEMHALERAAAAGLDGESIARWGEREVGRDFVEYLAYPLLAAYYGTPPEEASAALYHMLARAGMNVTVYALRGGAASFCDAVAQHVQRHGGEVRTGATVARVERDGGGVRIVGDGIDERFAAAVIAVPAPIAARLVAPGALPETAGEWLTEVRYRPAVSIALLLERPVGVGYFGLSFPRDESRLIAAVGIEENKLPGLVPPGRGLLVAFAAPAVSEEWIDAEPRRVLELALPELERAFPGVSAAVRRARLYRWVEGWPVFYPGYLHHLAAFRTGKVEGDAPIALAGDYLRTPSAEGAVSSGLHAAERLLARLGGG